MRFHKYSTAAAAVLAASAMMAASGSALATVVCNTTTVPLPVPAADNIGIYVDFVTGATGTGTPPAGWDFNPYESTTVNALRFWWNNDAAPHAGLLNAGGTAFAVLTAGQMIDNTGTYSGTSGATADPLLSLWRAGASGYLGVRFANEGTAATNFGWVRLTTTSPTGIPATIEEFCFQNNGTGIAAGALTPVSLQTFSVD